MTLLSNIFTKLFDKNTNETAKVSLKQLALQFNSIQRSLSSPEEEDSSFSKKRSLGDLLNTNLTSSETGSNTAEHPGDAFEEALAAGNIEELNKLILLEQKPITQIRDKEGSTLLHRAAKYQHEETIDYLLSKGLNINDENEILATPLFYSVSRNNVKISTLLLSRHAEVNIRDKFERFPLQIAVSHGWWKLVDILLLFKADVDFKGVKGRTVLHHCVEEGNEEKVEVLLTKFHASIEKKDANDETVLFTASRNSQMLEYLIRYYLEEYGQEKFAKFLKQCNSAGMNVLHFCVERGLNRSFFTLVSFIPDHHLTAVLNDHTLRYKMTLLHIAVVTNHLDLLRMMTMSKELDINAQDINGDTPLHVAARGMKENMAQLLMQAGCKKDIKNKNGLKASTIAKKYGVSLARKSSASQIPLEEEQASFRGSFSREQCQFSEEATNSLLIDASRFKLGNEIVDSEHYILFDIINELISSLGTHDCKGWQIGYLLGRLLEYTETHFKDEEGLMDKYGYTEKYKLLHKEQHHSFTSKIAELYKKYTKGETRSLDLELIQYLVGWLTTHILKYDKFLCKFIMQASLDSSPSAIPSDLSPAALSSSISSTDSSPGQSLTIHIVH